jgi:hypothetical protein
VEPSQWFANSLKLAFRGADRRAGAQKTPTAKRGNFFFCKAKIHSSRAKRANFMTAKCAGSSDAQNNASRWTDRMAQRVEIDGGKRGQTGDFRCVDEILKE